MNTKLINLEEIDGHWFAKAPAMPRERLPNVKTGEQAVDYLVRRQQADRKIGEGDGFEVGDICLHFEAVMFWARVLVLKGATVNLGPDSFIETEETKKGGNA